MAIERVYSRYKVHPEKTIPEESFGIIRADGHKFGKLTHLDFKRKPLDPEFMEAMVSATYQMMEDDIGAEFSLAYVKSNEISFLLPPHSTLFGRHPGMLNANVSGHMSAMFTRELCQRGKRSLGIFYADTFTFPEINEVEKFLAERQFEGYVNGINICMDYYWQKRNESKRDIKLQEALGLLKEEGLLFPGFNCEEYGVLIYH
jgi:tRNA(His) 5'-end guanylyltransferase